MPEGAVFDSPPVVGQVPPIDRQPQSSVAGANEPNNPLRQMEEVAKNAWDSTEGNVPQTSVHDEAEAIVRAASEAPLGQSGVVAQVPESFIVTPAPAEVQQLAPAEVSTLPITEVQSPAQTQKNKVPLGKLGAAIGIAAATMLGGAPVNGDMQLQQPRPATITQEFGAPPANIRPTENAAPPADELKDAMPSPVPFEKGSSTDESLACPGVVERTIEDGGSISSELFAVNGIGRYLTPDGKISKEVVYKDILCAMWRPENTVQMKKADPVLSEAIEDLRAHKDVAGEVTWSMLREVVERVNQSRTDTLKRPDGSNINPQLHLTYAGDAWQIPKFGESPVTVGLKPDTNLAAKVQTMQSAFIPKP